MNLLRETSNKALMMMCPGCKIEHIVRTQHSTDNAPNLARWTFNDNFDKPTLSPSILVRYDWGVNHEKRVCHSFVVDGVWQFLGDCTHELAGQHVPMIDVDTDYD